MSRTIVITGGSAGVGRAIARLFAEEGAQIGLIARGQERLDAAVSEVVDRGGRALACPADVADADAVEHAAAQIEDAFGPIDVWINAAMVTVFSPFAEMTADEFRRVTEVTYLGYVHGTMAALKRMVGRNSGTIVQIGSALAYRSIPLQSAYCGAKHAIVGFTDSIRSELLHNRSKVKLSVVQLPAVNTPQFDWARNKLSKRPQPLPPIYQPEVVADAVRNVVNHPRRELWLGWSAVKAIAGQKVAPWLLDRILAHQAYSGQQSDEPAEERQNNLYHPVPGDAGAHGRFDQKATAKSTELWIVKNTPMLAVAASVVVILGVGLAAAIAGGL